MMSKYGYQNDLVNNNANNFNLNNIFETPQVLSIDEEASHSFYVNKTLQNTKP